MSCTKWTSTGILTAVVLGAPAEAEGLHDETITMLPDSVVTGGSDHSSMQLSLPQVRMRPVLRNQMQHRLGRVTPRLPCSTLPAPHDLPPAMLHAQVGVLMLLGNGTLVRWQDFAQTFKLTFNQATICNCKHSHCPCLASAWVESAWECVRM